MVKSKGLEEVNESDWDHCPICRTKVFGVDALFHCRKPKKQKKNFVDDFTMMRCCKCSVVYFDTVENKACIKCRNK